MTPNLSTFFPQSHDCLRSGPPDVGELIVVSTTGGQHLNASFVKQHTHKLYQVTINEHAILAMLNLSLKM